MKKIFNLLLVMLAILGVACVPNFWDSAEKENGDETNNETAPLTFKIDIRAVSWHSAMVEIFPSNNKDTYYFSTMEKALFDQYESDEIFINDRVAELNARCEAEGYPLTEYLSQYSDGWHHDKELTPSTEYCVFVFGLTAEGVATTELTTATFETLSVGGGGNESPVGINQGDTVVEDLSWGAYMMLGDFYVVGAGSWLYTLYTEDGTGSLFIEVQTDLAASEPVSGEFPIEQSFDAGVAIAGGIDYREYPYGVFWVCYNDPAEESVKEKVFCQSGTVTIAKDGDIFIINVDAIDEYGNTLTASYRGELYNNTPTYN